MTTATLGFWQAFAADCAAKKNIRGTVDITAGMAAELLASIDARILGSLTDETRRYLPAVMAEIAELDVAIANNETALRRRAILFGCATPKTGVDTSIHVAVSVANVPAADWQDTAYGESVLRALPHPNGTDTLYSAPMPPTLSKRIAAVSHLLADPSALSVESLEACKGVGPKVARMAMAVAAPHARRFTVDMWHGRQLLALAGREYRVNVAVDVRAYPAIEEFFLAWADQNFPGIPVWAVQWACWNVCESRHRSHRALWADLA